MQIGKTRDEKAIKAFSLDAMKRKKQQEYEYEYKLNS